MGTQLEAVKDHAAVGRKASNACASLCRAIVETGSVFLFHANVMPMRTVAAFDSNRTAALPGSVAKASTKDATTIRLANGMVVGTLALTCSAAVQDVACPVLQAFSN